MKVFLLAGQSNMAGRAPSAEVGEPAGESASLQSLGIAWIPRRDHKRKGRPRLKTGDQRRFLTLAMHDYRTRCAREDFAHRTSY